MDKKQSKTMTGETKFTKSPKAIDKYKNFTLAQLNLMWSVLPTNNPNKDEIGEEIERRVDAQTDKSGKAISKSMDVDTALDILGL